MRAFLAIWALIALAIGQVSAKALKHRHAEFHNHAERHSEYLKSQAMKRGAALAEADATRMASMGAKVGQNSYTPNGNCWIGSDGPYTNDFVNGSGEKIIVVVWGPWGSWVNAKAPMISYTLNPGEKFTASFANGAVGAWSAIYADTKMVNGQISNTWGEFTFSYWGVVDVSREVNMSGRYMSIAGPKCTTDMDRCVFKCGSGENVCTNGYVLENCENGSQPGATYGYFEGTPSGGCGGMGNGGHFVTTFA